MCCFVQPFLCLKFSLTCVLKVSSVSLELVISDIHLWYSSNSSLLNRYIIQYLKQTVNHQPSSPPTTFTLIPVQCWKADQTRKEQIQEAGGGGAGWTFRPSSWRQTTRWKADVFFFPLHILHWRVNTRSTRLLCCRPAIPSVVWRSWQLISGLFTLYSGAKLATVSPL